MSYGRSNVGSYPFVSIHDVGPLPFQSYGPWLNVVGAEIAPTYGEHAVVVHPAYFDATRRGAWQRTRALIHSAARDTRYADSTLDFSSVMSGTPLAYVWSLHVDGTTEVYPAASVDEAFAGMRDRASDGYSIAIAVFDKMSPHWPKTPVSWHLSDDPSYDGVIAQQIAKRGPYGGIPNIGYQGFPWGYEILGADPVGQGLDLIRRQARAAVEGLPGRVIGVVRDANNRWVVKSFRNADVADDWFGHVIRNRARFTYAAYFDKDDPLFPHPLNEEIGAAPAPAVSPSPIPRLVAEVP